jgi:hypothetical protein
LRLGLREAYDGAMKRAIGWLGWAVLLLGLAVSSLAAWTDDPEAVAQRGPGGVLKKVWVVRNGAEVYRDAARSVVDSRLGQNAKAYLFGEAADGLYAIGDKPLRRECAHFGFIAAGDVVIWDTDQALRFVGSGEERYVELFRDEALTDKIAEATVEGPADPTVMPFPIFRKSADGRAYEIAFIYTAASGADTYDERVQESLRKVITKDISSIDVAFVMDVTGSMANELAAARARVSGLIDEFSQRTVTVFGRQQPLRLRFAFVGYRDWKEGDQWVEVVPFAGRGQEDGFDEQLGRVQAYSRNNNDWEESVVAGLREALKLDWRKEHAKAMILIGDAAPLDEGMWPEVMQECLQRYVRIYSIVVETEPSQAAQTWRSFQKMASATGGLSFQIADAEDTETVDRILDSLAVEEAAVTKAPEVVRSWAEGGADISRDVQEFLFRGVLPDPEQRPIPPTVYVSSRRDDARQLCLYKSRASLYEMLGDMQTDFVEMIEDPSPALLAAINAGGVEIIAELNPDVLQSIIALDDYARASLEIRSMLEMMPELPGIIRELNDKGLAAEWHELARKTADLSRFVSEPGNFYRDHAWVPFDVLDFGRDE